jgi:hypothetical protein
MLIVNGYIEPKIKTGGGIDPETGYPIPPSFTWGDKIPCQFRANSFNYKGKANGESFTVAKYEILIQGSFSHEVIKLSGSSGNELGEFSVMQIEPLMAVGLIKILV